MYMVLTAFLVGSLFSMDYWLLYRGFQILCCGIAKINRKITLSLFRLENNLI